MPRASGPWCTVGSGRLTPGHSSLAHVCGLEYQGPMSHLARMWRPSV